MSDTLFFDDWGVGSNMVAPSTGYDFSLSMPTAVDGLKSIGSMIGDVASYGVNLAGQIQSIRNTADNASFNRYLQTTQLETAKTVAGAQGNIAQLQAQTALAKAQQAFNSAAGIGGNSSGYSTLMLWLTIAGVAIAFMGMKK